MPAEWERSIDVNGTGMLLTTESCLLNPNRNPGLSQQQIEQRLAAMLGVEEVLWLAAGIVGDETDGHIDDVAPRFRGHPLRHTADSNQKIGRFHHEMPIFSRPAQTLAQFG